MGAAQSELSMDEILASIRRIIHEEEETKQPVRPSGENTVVLSEERAAQAEADGNPEAAEPTAEELADLRDVAASVEALAAAAPVDDEPAATVSLPPVPEEAVAEVTNDAPLHPEQPFEALSPATMTTKHVDAEPAQQVEAEPIAPAPAAPAPELQEDLPPMPATQPAAQSTESITTPAASTLVNEQQSQNVAAAFSSLKQHVQVTQQGGKTLEDMVAQMIQPMLKAWLNEHLPAIVERKVEEEVRRLSDR